VVQVGTGLAMRRGLPEVDRAFLALAAGFLLLCWVSVAWSIVPLASWRGAGQESAILLAVLLVCVPPTDPRLADRLFPVLLVACLVGVLLACADMATGLHGESVISGKPGLASETKYNRGLDYLALMAWPALAYAWARRWWWLCGLLLLAVGAAEGRGVSLAGRVADVAGFVVLLLAWVAPRLTAWALAIGTGLFVAGLPFGLHVVTSMRGALAPYLKPSGMHRLEIADYMTARVFERPLLGWGLLSANSVPIRPAELAHYVWVDPRGVYPHDQWLELWVELGVAGATLGLAFALLVLRRIQRLPAAIRPFACAAFASAMAIACVNYEITTDSWWAALGACALLFMILGQMTRAAGRVA
jgi:exopolysaccharide production protein ExoQ